jgi:hypothetical protein
MPVAVKFKSRGTGNGFPECVDKLDVSSYDYWTTFSGWSEASEPVDDAAKTTSIFESRDLAMKMFWNMYALNADAESNWDSESSFITESHINVNGGNATETSCVTCYDGADGSYSNPEPIDRVCSGGFRARLRTRGSGAAFDNQVYLAFWPRDIWRMYDGDENNEANFVGYGARFFVGEVSGNPGGLLSKLTLQGCADDPGFITHEVGYCEISGFHLVCVAQGTTSRDPTVPSASSDSGSGFSSSVTINSFEFFTYP